MRNTEPGFGEFITLAALLFSLAALAIDSMLPAMPAIGENLQVSRDNDRQWIVSVLFLGLGLGQLICGPIADSVGRRPVILAGLMLFIAGTLLCQWSEQYATLLWGRFLQGVGAASPRIIMIAIIRDRFHGAQMARVMSFVMSIFILVPAIAPLLGQGILLVATWRAIFGVMLMVGLVALVWFYWRQAETLPAAQRRALGWRPLVASLGEIVQQRQTLAAMFAMGLVFATFVAYLSTVQQVLGELYQLGAAFPFVFAILSLAIGGALLLNSGLVMRFGIRKLCRMALLWVTLWSVLASIVLLTLGWHPHLGFYFLYSLPLFFGLGILFGNLNALAMEPLGHIAGLAASVVGSVSTVIAVPLGAVLGQIYAGSVLPLTLGFALFGGIALLIFQHWVIEPPSSAE
jgi:DHA1 family bicyclomycin/chloramphenicol resistance-like MFS transporter